MRIDGKSIASSILIGLKNEVEILIQSGVKPALSVFLVGEDPASLAYIRQKQKAADEIGVLLQFRHFPESIPKAMLEEEILRDAHDSSIHAVILQRPVPSGLGDGTEIIQRIPKNKDVDGFLPGSPFPVPVADAIGEILTWVKADMDHVHTETISEAQLFSWLRTQKIAVIGRGETAGSPILHYLRKNNCTTSSIHTKTSHPERIVHESDIVISCVGKQGVVRGDMVKRGAILISVGLFRNDEGKLEGDYKEADILDIASYYTPTPGGVGPVNVACLMKNCIKACKIQTGGTI